MRVELTDCGDQTDTALGDQVTELDAVPAILKRDGDHVAQVCFHEPVRGVLIALEHTERKLVLFFATQLRNRSDLLNVSIEGSG